MIDACASGGRRNDLESMRCSVPLHKTDADYSDFTLKHCMHQSLYNWFPYYGTPVTGPGYPDPNDKYALRSAFVPWIALGFDVRKDNLDYSLVQDCDGYLAVIPEARGSAVILIHKQEVWGGLEGCRIP